MTVSNQKEIRISKDQLKGFCEKINLVYISRRVSNVFKANLQDLLKKSMSFTDAEVETMLETVLKLEQQVGYLKKVTTSDGRVVLQATLSKFAELMAFIETMP